MSKHKAEVEEPAGAAAISSCQTGMAGGTLGPRSMSLTTTRSPVVTSSMSLHTPNAPLPTSRICARRSAVQTSSRGGRHEGEAPVA